MHENNQSLSIDKNTLCFHVTCVSWISSVIYVFWLIFDRKTFACVIKGNICLFRKKTTSGTAFFQRHCCKCRTLIAIIVKWIAGWERVWSSSQEEPKWIMGVNANKKKVWYSTLICFTWWLVLFLFQSWCWCHSKWSKHCNCGRFQFQCVKWRGDHFGKWPWLIWLWGWLEWRLLWCIIVGRMFFWTVSF